MQFNPFHHNTPHKSELGETLRPSAPILLCDDDPFYLEAIRILLTAEGYTVAATTSGEEALALLRDGSHHFSLILCAIEMSGVDGFEVLRQTQAIPGMKTVPFVFLSMISDLDTLDRAREHGAKDYFIKANAGLDRLPELVRKYT